MTLHVGIGWLATQVGRADVMSGSPVQWFVVKSLLLKAMWCIPVIWGVELWRCRNPGEALLRFRNVYLTPRSIVGVLVGVLFIATEAYTHASWKSTIGWETPFSWDPRLASLDRMLHGANPWELLTPVLASAESVRALDVAYAWWQPVYVMVGVLVLWLPDRALRTRVLTTWALIWVMLGTVGSHLMPSAGPAFYGHVVSQSHEFELLQNHLRHLHWQSGLLAVERQQTLWANVQLGNPNPWLSVSAMPSIHVAIAFFFTIVAYKVRRILVVPFAASALLMMVGSVALGWHYAVDGYASMLGVGLLWWLSGRLLGARETRGMPLRAAYLAKSG